MNLLRNLDVDEGVHFTTSRLLLRSPVFEDAETIQRLASKRIIAEMTSRIPHPYPADGALKWIDEARSAWREKQSLSFAICLRATGEVAGAISIQLDQNDAKVGYWVGIPHWGNWYASEALHRVIRFGFNQLGLRYLNSSYFRHQPDSGMALHKAGLPYECFQPLGGNRLGQCRDNVVHGITAERWRANIRISSLS